MQKYAIVLPLLFLAYSQSLLARPITREEFQSGEDGATQIPRLIRQGVNINEPIAGSDGADYPLTEALIGGNATLADVLLSNGADPNKFWKEGPSNLQWGIDRAGGTPEGQQVIRKMINSGARVNFTTKGTNTTALMFAAMNGYADLVELLLSKGADRSIRTKGSSCLQDSEMECSAADMARKGDHVEIALRLEGKDPAAYRATIAYAVIHGDLGTVQRYIAEKRDVNLKQEISSSSLLHLAVRAKQPAVLKALLAAKADPNVVNFAGNSPLRYAITDGTFEMAKALIDAGAKNGHAQVGGCGEGHDEFLWALGYMQEAAPYMIQNGAIDPANPGLVFQEIHGQDAKAIDLVQMLLDRGARPTQADVDRLELVMNANEYLRKRGHIYKIIAMYKANLAPTQRSVTRPSKTSTEKRICD